jgi:hypothetical protein
VAFRRNRFGVPKQSPVSGVTVTDVIFVVITLALFGLLGLISKGAERL